MDELDRPDLLDGAIGSTAKHEKLLSIPGLELNCNQTHNPAGFNWRLVNTGHTQATWLYLRGLRLDEFEPFSVWAPIESAPVDADDSDFWDSHLASVIELLPSLIASLEASRFDVKEWTALRTGWGITQLELDKRWARGGPA